MGVTELDEITMFDNVLATSQTKPQHRKRLKEVCSVYALTAIKLK